MPAVRVPRVTGVTRCMLPAGYTTISPAGELDRLRSIGVLDQQLAAVVFFRRSQEQRGRQVGAQPVRGTGNLPDGVVDVRAKGHAGLVAIEQRRIHMARQRGADEESVVLQCAQILIADLARGRSAAAAADSTSPAPTGGPPSPGRPPTGLASSRARIDAPADRRQRAPGFARSWASERQSEANR